jgi:Asp-tRNA(Asn)/Glu-tRNA(Gln) amidotransferase A subunit family amidase
MGPPLETARAMAAAVADGRTTSEDLVRRALDRLEAWQPVTNAFSEDWADEALAEAREADAAVEAGAPLGPLHGVPVAVKDLFDVAGRISTGCSRAYEGRPPATEDAEAVRSLRRAGAVFVGKTNQHELACGATNLVSACGPTANPWDPARITGGSSGGSGAAVAAGVVPIALGSDTGGSIRMPASLCGCWGLKPTTGRFPNAGMMPLAPGLDTPGPLVSDAGDLDLWWAVATAGPPPEVEPRGLRVGVLGDWFREWSHPETWSAVEAVADVLGNLGAAVGEADGTGIEDVRRVWTDVAWAEFAEAHAWLVARPDLVFDQTAASIRHGAELDPGRLAASRARVPEYGAWFAERFRAFDVLLFPATPIPAPRADDEDGTVEVAGGRRVNWRRGGALAWFTEPVNLAGVPALAVPAGRSTGGLPLGVQLAAPRGRDELLVGLAGALEASDARFRPGRPSLPGNSYPGKPSPV